MAEDHKNRLASIRAATGEVSAADALKRTMGGSLASDVLKAVQGVSALSASTGKITAASDALKLSGITSVTDALKNLGVSQLSAIAPSSIGAACASDALRMASPSPLSSILDATRHLTDERYAVTVPSPRVADSPRQAEGGAQREPPIARMQALRPIKSPEALGRMVRQAREGMGLTQAAFADAAGVGRRFVSELENGKATLELGKVMAVCAAAGLDLMAAPR